MKCLIDADVLLHELGWSGQFKDKETGEEVLLPFETVADLLKEKIRVIEYECEADEPSTLFISSSPFIVDTWNRSATYFGRPLVTHEDNFRYAVSKTKPYKGTRKNPKPFHFTNLVAEMMHNYDVVISQGGLEADDEVCIAQKEALSKGEETIICSRDKDLRICAGWHYSWECGKQGAIGPHLTDSLGKLELNEKGKVTGYGVAFFLNQMLVGDTADNIPGLQGVGDAASWKLLSPIMDNKSAMIKAVKDLYKEKLGDASKEYFLEQASLLWMVQDRGQPFNLGKLLK